MADLFNSVSLTQRLVRCNTITGSHGEQSVLERLSAILHDAGFTVILEGYDKTDPTRYNLAAHLHPEMEGPALCLAGHIDTVPLSKLKWKHAPFAAEIDSGRLYGRGSCDMKSGMAAMISAALRMAPQIRNRDFVIHVYGGEEMGCQGSFHLVRNQEAVQHIGAVIVGEPTNARPVVGHKGALWFTLRAKGKTAHASMPDKGTNALGILLPAALRLLEWKPKGSDKYLGSGTAVLSTLHAGLNSNSVPDLATMTLDIRTVPGMAHDALHREIAQLAGEHISLKTMLDVPAILTPPDHPWVKRVFALYKKNVGKPAEITTLQGFTDAAALRTALPNVPVLIYGPGNTAMAHQVDEYCEVSQIMFMEEMYCQIIEDWYTSI